MNNNRQRQQQNQNNSSSSPDFLTQLKNFGKSIGLYARVCITVNVLIFIFQKIFMSDSIHVALIFGFNY